MIDRPLPTWAEELATLLPACAHFLLAGNVRDLYLVEAGLVGEPDLDPHERVLVDLPAVVEALLLRRGVEAIAAYDVTLGAASLPESAAAQARVEAIVGSKLVDIAPQGSLTGLADLIEAVAEATEPVGLLIRSASRLVRDPNHLGDREFEFFRCVDRIARTAQPGESGLFNPVMWAVDREQDMPAWFVAGNEKLRSLVVPLPDTGDRSAAARMLVGRIPVDPAAAAVDPPDPVATQATLSEHTAGLTLVAMESIVGVARDQGIGVDGLEDAARAYRVGILDNPWRQTYLSERLRAELSRLDAAEADPAGSGATGLVDRVLGQEPAVRKSLDILVRSVAGMTAAHTTSGSRPRGVLFFAGPTGVGKTELAKALTKLVFDDERLYVRFDMSEFSAEHAADRLIGAPPGYTGYERGGELTNAVRMQPFSLVLFDEIEKANPLVLDKFLQLLDDGRLTDGRGETAYFTEAIIVFTSNLGIHKDRIVTAPDGSQTIKRELNVDPALHEPDEVVRRVKEGIVEHFTLRLGRPELLNRIGDDNIVVFDFIRRPTGERILRKMLGNVLARVADEHQLTVAVGDAAAAVLDEQCLDRTALMMGGRGIGARLESVLVNPLATAIFLERDHLGPTAELVDLLPEGGGAWHAVLRSA